MPPTAAHPALTIPHSAPVSSASRLPTAAINSSSCTYCWFAAVFGGAHFRYRCSYKDESDDSAHLVRIISFPSTNGLTF